MISAQTPLFANIAALSLKTLSANLNPYQSKAAIEIESDYATWLNSLFPAHVRGGFSQRHKELWGWAWAMKRGVRPRPFVGIWARGGGKSTSAELITAMCGAMDKRTFILYIRSTQDKADESIQNIANLLETSAIDTYYPKLGQRKLGKFGASKGWRREALRTASGLIVQGIGLDVAARGIKVDSFRPDLIILDDIDERHDTEQVSLRKKQVITESILPAGSTDCAVFGIQNLIIHHGIFSQLTRPNCDFLIDRIVSGPYPAVEGLRYENNGAGYKITGGKATWTGQSLEVCEQQINTWGLAAFERESQHLVDSGSGGMFSAIKYRHCEPDKVPDLVKVVCWVDPAVTETGDCQGIQIDGIDGPGKKGTVYRLYSWEGNDGPTGVVEMALLKGTEYKVNTIGFETNQGGDLWRDTYRMISARMLADKKIEYVPKFAAVRADSGTGGKAHRANPMLVDYENGRIVHVYGTHEVLESALSRFPLSKPFDLTDAAVWSHHDIRKASSMA